MASLEHDGNGVHKENEAHEGNGTVGALPPPSPVILPDFVPTLVEPEQVKKKVVRVPISRRGHGSKGQKITLLTNHFKVNVTNVDGHFFHYSVCPHLLLYLQFSICFLATW